MTGHPDGNPLDTAVFTDLYQLTMAQAYDAEQMSQSAVFELYFRSLPSSRNYIVAAGLADVLDFLESFEFSPSDIDYLREQGELSPTFLERLRHVRFMGDVWAVPEGTIVFPYEPLLRVVAPIMEAQLVETYALNQIHFQSIAATKASRVVAAAAGRNVVDFGSRRAHGTDAALKVARTSYLAGAAGTSNVLAGKRYGIPIFGTMAHSYIQAHDDERQAFTAFAREFPQSTMLVDTYDTLDGIKNVIDLSRELGDAFEVRAVRLDSGDLTELSRRAREMLDEAGLSDVQIFVSSGMDEYKIRDLLNAEAPIDGFGVGTNLAVSDDAPSLDMAYKLVEYAGEPRMKLSSGKAIYPGGKQVYREMQSGTMRRDLIATANEEIEGEPLLRPVMRGGKRLPDASPPLLEIRRYAQQQFGLMPKSLQSLETADAAYEVRVSDRLERQYQNMAQSISNQQR